MNALAAGMLAVFLTSCLGSLIVDGTPFFWRSPFAWCYVGGGTCGVLAMASWQAFG